MPMYVLWKVIHTAIFNYYFCNCICPFLLTLYIKDDFFFKPAKKLSFSVPALNLFFPKKMWLLCYIISQIMVFEWGLIDLDRLKKYFFTCTRSFLFLFLFDSNAW